MVCCLNPDCKIPQNPAHNTYCFSCGTKLTPLLANRYLIIQPLGRGEFGKTYIAKDTRRLNADCVVKQFSPALEIQRNPKGIKKAIELFNQEAQQLLQLEEHPQIPTLFEYFEQDKRLYLVQQLIKGHTLSVELEKTGKFTEVKIRQLLEDLLPILQFIHNRTNPVIHRDIKPDNIIRRQSDGKLVLIDFGISKELTGTMLTRMGTTTGTPGYAPSEQMLYGKAYPASDLYSLGATCIHLITGEHPFYLFDPRQNRWLWQEQLKKKNINVSNHLQHILDKLLTDIVQRYQSADQVLKDLSLKVSFPIISSPPPALPAVIPLQELTLKIFEFDMITLNAQSYKHNRIRGKSQLLIENLGNGITLEMVSIPGGSFMMGSSATEEESIDSEIPQHQVTVPTFFMGRNQVTQAQWRAVAKLPQVHRLLHPDPSFFKGENRPVEQVSWYDCQEFCDRLAKKTGKDYRLPSEAEWEYACRAGTDTIFHFGNTINTEVANYNGDYVYGAGEKGKYRKETTIVGSFEVANAFGLFDMHGNVWEWCADPWHDNYHRAPSDGSVWEFGANNTYKVMRGGSWSYVPYYCSSSSRNWYAPANRSSNFGFRVVFGLRMMSSSFWTF